MLTLHLLLLIGVVLLTAICLVLYRGHPQRSIWIVLLHALPTWLLGVTTMLVLSANGAPAIEWMLPIVCILLLGIACKSDRAFIAATGGLTVAAFLLCLNFFSLTSNGYSGADHSRMTATSLKNGLKRAADKLRKEHAPDEVLPAQKLLAQTQRRYVKEWHTPVTRLYRVEKQPVAIWYPGGTVADGVEKLEIRNE